MSISQFLPLLVHKVLFFSTSCVGPMRHSGPIALSGVSGRQVEILGISKVRLQFVQCQCAE